MGIYDRDWYKDSRKPDPAKDCLYNPKLFRQNKPHENYASAANAVRTSDSKSGSFTRMVGAWLLIGLALYLLMPPMLSKVKGNTATPKPEGAYKCLSVDGRALYTDAECRANQSSIETKMNHTSAQPSRIERPSRQSVAWESAEVLMLQAQASRYADERSRLFRSAARQLCMAIKEGMSDAQISRAAALQQDFQMKARYSRYADAGAQDSYMATALMGVATRTCSF